MDPERWQLMKTIFEKALALDTPQRDDFLKEACDGDNSLKDEIKTLLELHDEDSFLEKPASSMFSDLLESEKNSMPPGKELGSYSFTRRIGYGGMGVVYLGYDHRLDRPVAIKMLSGNLLKDAQLKERLRREARAAAKLSHPGIATVYALEESGNDVFIISEYVNGGTLREVLARDTLPLEMLLDIGVQIARALTVAHECGIVHRDLKPENIMLTKDGNVKILDFGLARIESERSGKSEATTLTQTGMFLGTPAYASPEQLMGSKVDYRTDLFSFGIILYEMACGKHPFGTGTSIATVARILEGKIPDMHMFNPSLPRKLCEMVQMCLQKNPEDRYSDTRAFLDDFEMLNETCRQKPKSQEDKRDQSAAPKSKLHPLWWWQFHQAVAGFGYYGMIYPQWWLKEDIGGIEGSLLFFPLLIAVMISANLRLHLWFTSRFYPSELSAQRRKVYRWIRFGDCLFVSMLGITAVIIHVGHARVATLHMAVAIGALVAFTLIEPTTIRAALETENRK
ncbi:MAG: serine/threonine-protein kinase [Acidobacteriota bacterium]